MTYTDWAKNKELISLWNESWNAPHMQIALKVIQDICMVKHSIDHKETTNLLESYALNFARVEGQQWLYGFITNMMGKLPVEIPEDDRPYTEKSHGEADLLDENDQELLQQILQQNLCQSNSQPNPSPIPAPVSMPSSEKRATRRVKQKPQ